MISLLTLTLGSRLQSSCAEAASFDLTAEILASCIVEVENATQAAIKIRDNPSLAGFDVDAGKTQGPLSFSPAAFLNLLPTLHAFVTSDSHADACIGVDNLGTIPL